MTYPTGWRRTAVTAAVVLACLSGCASCTSNGSSSTATTVPAPTDLRDVIFDQFPANYFEEPVGYDLEGPLDLANAVKSDSARATTGAADLMRAGFERGYRRAWRVKGVDKSVVIYVLLLGSAKQAAAHLNEKRFGDNSALSMTMFPTPGSGDSAGFTSLFTNSLGAQVDQFVDLAVGPLYYRIQVSGTPGSIMPSDALGIAQSQYAKASTTP